MASEAQTFPFFSTQTWWALRKKFNSTIPKEVSPNYIATAFNMSEESAKANVISKLKQIGFIDETGKPTDLVKQWRDDDQYASVCKQLIDKLYPSELVEAIDDPLNEMDKVTKWFKNKTGHGDAAANKMARFFSLLVEADVSKQNDLAKPKSEKIKSNSVSPPKKATQNNSEKTIKQPAPILKDDYDPSKSNFKPSIHIDVQIHISPDSSPEQIDKIFESMAKHLSGFKHQ
jgi:hypothetical protein